ncbi:MAG TPA: hypothetical protein VGP43_05135 [Chitinophagaceae bacterium]|nr:hypothetical protein [Chitinophagaceae bacterium]
MMKWFQKILFIVISLSFFISATEMDLGEVNNTFFDEYDTYVRAENVLLNQSSFSCEEQNTCISTSLFLAYYSLYKTHVPSDTRHEYSSYLNFNPPKLFLRNSVWRI